MCKHDGWAACRDRLVCVSCGQTAVEVNLINQLSTLTAQLAAAEKVANATRLYLKHINSPLCIGWDDLLDALSQWQQSKEGK